MSDLKITATSEQIAGAVFGSLLATVDNFYMTQLMSLYMGRVATGAALAVTTGEVEKATKDLKSDLDRGFSLDVRRGRLTAAFDMVIKRLPTDSPFRAPLEQHRDQDVAKLKDETT